MRYECEQCDVVYRVLSDGSIFIIVWDNIFLGDKEYRVRIYPVGLGKAGTPQFIIHYWATREKMWEQLVKLNFIPNWTPQTVVQKLKAYLPFL